MIGDDPWMDGWMGRSIDSLVVLVYAPLLVSLGTSLVYQRRDSRATYYYCYTG